MLCLGMAWLLPLALERGFVCLGLCILCLGVMYKTYVSAVRLWQQITSFLLAVWVNVVLIVISAGQPLCGSWRKTDDFCIVIGG